VDEEAKRILDSLEHIDDRGARLVMVVTNRYVGIITRASGRRGVVVVVRGENIGLAIIWLESRLGVSILQS